MPPVFVYLTLFGLAIFLLMLIAIFWPKYVSANPTKILPTVVCVTKGHTWHEGDDTPHTLAGAKNSGFHWCTFTWRCKRCGVCTEPGDSPPPNFTWDHTWVNPMDEPSWFDGRPGDCANIYRKRQDKIKEIKMRQPGLSKLS